MNVGTRIDVNTLPERTHAQPAPEVLSQPNISEYNALPSIQCSPNHLVFTKCDK